MNRPHSLTTFIWLTSSLSLLITSSINAQEPNKLPKPFTAEYQLEKKGMTVAQVKMNLNKQNDTWHYQTLAKPKGWASMFSSDRIEQYSVVKIKNGVITPVKYHKRNKDKIHSEIHYRQTTATASHEDEQSTTNLDKPYYDEQSLELVINNDLRHNNPTPSEYFIIDELTTKAYQFENQGIETIQSYLGDIQTIKLVRTRGKRQTITWHAPELDYLAIQIKQYKNKKLKSSMTLNAHNFQTTAQ